MPLLGYVEVAQADRISRASSPSRLVERSHSLHRLLVSLRLSRKLGAAVHRVRRRAEEGGDARHAETGRTRDWGFWA